MVVFLDVLPRLGLTEAEAAMAKLRTMAKETGEKMGVSLSEGTAAGLNKLKQEAIATERVVSDAFSKQAVAAAKYEAAVAKVAEVEKLRGTQSAAYQAAMAKQLDLEAKSAAAARDYSDATAAAAISSGKFAAAEDGKAKAVATTSSVLNGVGKTSFLLFAGAVGLATDKAADFEQSQTKIVASAGETASGIKQVSDGILQMAGTVGYSAGQLSDAMYVVEKGGFRAASGGLDVLKAAAQGANAEQADLAEVTKGLTISMNDFHFPTQNAADVMSKLVVATGASTATFQEFTGALHSVEPAAAAAGIKYEDLLATISQGTKSGASADQVTENIRNAISALSGAQGPARDAMRQIGIDADDVSQHLNQRGLAGTFQYLADTIKSKMDPNNLIPTGVFKQSAGELDALTNSLSAMSPAAQQVAEGYRNGTVTAKEFRAAVMGSSGEDTKRLQDYKKWADDLNDFSTRYKNGQSTLVTYNEELRKVTGTVAGQSIALQVTGENADATNALIAKLNQTTREHDGTVKGFNESQETLNAKMRDAKAAFGAAAIELGEAFIPAIKEAADGIKATAEFLAAHQEAVRNAVVVVGALGTAWAVTKTAMAIGSLVSTLGTGMATIGGFVMGLTGRYQALAGAASEAAAAEQAAASGGFGKGAAAGAAFRGSGALAAGAAAAPLVATSWGFLGVAQGIYDGSSAEGKSGADAARGRGLAGLTRGGGTGALPVAGADQYAAPGAQAARRGRSNIPGLGLATAGVPDNVPGAIPALREDPANLFDPGAPGGPIDSGGGAKKPPKGDKDDPIWIKPGDPADFKGGGDNDHGITGSSIISGGFDFSPKSIGTFFTALLTDLALGNPIGKTLAAKRGESKDAPLYVTNVDVQNAQDRLTKAIRDNGPDSAEAKHAAEQLAGTQAAVGTTGGYFDPATGGISASSGVVPGGKGAEGWRKTVADTVAKYAPQLGIPADKQGAWTNAIVSQIGTESGGNPGADNPNDSNGRGGTQHVSGLLQYLPSSYANSGGKLTGLPYMDPVGQIAGALYAPQNPDGSPAGIGHGVGWGPVSKPIVAPPAVPAAPAATGLFGGGSGGPGGIYDPSQILGGGGESPALPSNGGGGFNIGGGASRGPSRPTWQPSQYTGRSSGYIGGSAAGAKSPGTPAGGLFTGGGGSSGAANTAPAARSWGSGKGATSSVASSIISAAGPLAAMAPGSAQAAQLVDRTIGYVGQLGGIAVEGLMQSLIPTGGGGGIGDPSHSVIGKIAGGIAGAHKSAPNTAGTAAPPGPKPADDPNMAKGSGANGDTHNIGAQNNGVQIMGDAHISTPSPQAFASDKPQNQYPTATR